MLADDFGNNWNFGFFAHKSKDKTVNQEQHSNSQYPGDSKRKDHNCFGPQSWNHLQDAADNLNENIGGPVDKHAENAQKHTLQKVKAEKVCARVATLDDGVDKASQPECHVIDCGNNALHRIGFSTEIAAMYDGHDVSSPLRDLRSQANCSWKMLQVALRLRIGSTTGLVPAAPLSPEIRSELVMGLF